jgi:hypothetical protein
MSFHSDPKYSGMAQGLARGGIDRIVHAGDDPVKTDMAGSKRVLCIEQTTVSGLMDVEPGHPEFKRDQTPGVLVPTIRMFRSAPGSTPVSPPMAC